MNRPFKFRAWNIKEKYWVNPGAIRCSHNNNNLSIINDEELEEYIIQQYTGLTDIEGKEIFEGDILLCLDRTNSLFVEVSFNAQQAAFLFENRFAAVDFLKYNRVKVAGNIFENKDLLI